ncbi:signal peptidase II [Paenibacillus mendelii]|uniref:Lipoprotein signal peptidase n=1 Tax=Paenibacillus mendelii TaxID=206163 RepID=A0ABV6J1R9_9BACL|nr:signal peptidase II [Paenibacillus mendelii]MCQ6562749.1 signal peptidase II [Paenibacillus mendelii]
MFRYFLVVIGVTIADHIVKWLISMYMTIGQQITVIPGVFGLTSIRNRGAAFGMLQGQRVFFIIATSIVLIGIILYLYKIHREKKLLSYGFALILGGALGNFIDRIYKGEVVDMFQVYFIDFPIFNVADSVLCIGVAIVLIDTWRDSRADRAANKLLEQ